MEKTSSNQEKKKKTKVRKLINRAKNGLQRVRKFCRQHVMPVMLATAIIGGAHICAQLQPVSKSSITLIGIWYPPFLPRKATICRSRTEMTRFLHLTV